MYFPNLRSHRSCRICISALELSVSVIFFNAIAGPLKKSQSGKPGIFLAVSYCTYTANLSVGAFFFLLPSARAPNPHPIYRGAFLLIESNFSVVLE